MPVRWQPSEQVHAVRYLLKWAALLTPLSLIVGTIVAAFLGSLELVTAARFDHPALLFALPLAGLAVGLLYHRFGRSVESGNNLMLDEIHAPGGGVPARIVPLIFIGTVVSHLAGASVGREGTAVQIGGGIAGWLNRWPRLSAADLRTFLMAGIAAGFGAVFGTPLAGAVFALEVLAVGRIEYGALIPVLFASLLADWTAAAWGAQHTQYAIAIAGETGAGTPFDALLMGKAVIAGVAFGLASILFGELTHSLQRVFRTAIAVSSLRPVAGGVLIIALVYALGTRDYLGLGVTSPDPGATTIVSSFAPGGATPLAWWWKMVFTALSLGSGFKGGEVTPLFFVGATLGNWLAELLRAPVDLFAGLGFVAVFAGAANTPLACTIMGIELFGAGATVYLAAACFVAYLVSGHTGIYLSQRIAAPKVATVRLEPDLSLRSLREGRVSLVAQAATRWRARRAVPVDEGEDEHP